MKKVLFVASEASPYAKSGGLADVAGSLPKELLKMGYDIKVVMPLYREVKQEMEYVTDYPIYMQGKKESCIVRKNVQKIDDKHSLTTYFIDNIYYFDRDGLYCHPDEAERFAFFDKAVVELIRIEKPDVVHLNDWEAGPIALLLKEKNKDIKAKIVYTIHNMEYNGRFNKGNLYHLDLNDSYYTPERLEFYGDISFSKAGILYSDIITTVSKSYANEIQTKEYGFGYEGLMSMKASQGKLIGITNAIDYDEYNPEKDKEIFRNYNYKSFNLKRDNKIALQKEVGLEVKEVPLLSIVSRIVSHKGYDILVEGLNELLKKDIQFIALGVGDQHYINRLEYLKERYPEKVSINNYFDHTLAKKIYAGSDIFLMPSVFEPCGLSQLISFRYGTIPVVRSTGGLRDTVIGYASDKDKGNGFTFWGNSVYDFVTVTNKALELYKKKDEWKKLAKKDMQLDFSWKGPAKEYKKIYEEL